MPQPHELILIVDYGSQYTQLIARRIREQHVFCRIVPPRDLTSETLEREQPKGLILSGGPASVYQPNAPLPDKRIFEAGIPTLGICYGMQAMAHLLGGSVERAEKREYGKAPMRVPRGSEACGYAMPQWWPRPGASLALAKAEPTMTASEPQASALQMSPPLRIPPSVMMGT